MKHHLIFFIGAPAVGLLLYWWASAYNIKWISKQMLLLMAIMFLDRLLYYAWRSTEHQ